jgi:hypothetical protein
MGAQSQQMKPSTRQRSLAAVALAWLFYLMLADASMETFLSGSAVRWWVAGSVLLYFGIVIALWRALPSRWQSLEWPTRATFSFMLLLGLLALTAWLPGGLRDGMRLVGQPTSRVFSLLTIAAIVLAAISVLRLSWLPRWAKIAVGVLAIYALAGFAKGLFSGIEYPDLLHGESLWTRLPSWLQGACIGALLVVPLGVVARAAQMLHTTPGVSRAWDLRAVTAMTMSVLMAVSAITSTGVFGPQPTAAEIVVPLAKSYQDLQHALAGPQPKTPLTPQQVADRLDKLFSMMGEAEKQIPRDTFDPQAIIDRVGKNPKKLFEWVRDKTYFVPYKGLLRGEKGVLMDRLGNSLDRAMLLYSLLLYVDQPARLAHGTLTETQARDVLSKVRPFPSFEDRTGSASSAEQTEAFAKQYAEQNHLDVDEIRSNLDEIKAQQQRVQEKVQRRVAAQASMIAAAAGRPPRSALAAGRADQIRAAMDHWWVQCQDAGSWVDFDPTLPGSMPAQVLTMMQNTVEPRNHMDFGEDLVHTIEIRVVIEVWKDGQVKEVPVLIHKLVPADFIGEPIVLRQIPVHWPQDLNVLQEKDPLEQFRQAVLHQTEWTPVLTIGSRNTAQYSFDDHGNLTDASLVGFGTKELGQNITGMLSVPGAMSVQTGGQSQGAEVTAEWIYYQIQTPGQPQRTVRRELFDLLGASARSKTPVLESDLDASRRLERGFMLLGDTEILPIGWDLSPSYLSLLLVRDLRDDQHRLQNVFGGLKGAPQQQQTQGAQQLKLPSKLYSLALARAQWQGFSHDVYLDHLNVLTLHTFLRQAEHSRIMANLSFDIVTNDVAVRFGIDGFWTRVQQGTLDTITEAILATCPGVTGQFCSRTGNASEALASYGNSVSVTKSTFLGSSQLRLPPDAGWLMQQQLDAGNLLLIPISQRHSTSQQFDSWWRVDARTGTTLGVNNNGWGLATAEYTLTEKESESLATAAGAALISAACMTVYEEEANREAIRGEKPHHCSNLPCWAVLWGGLFVSFLLVTTVIGSAIALLLGGTVGAAAEGFRLIDCE